VISQDLHVVVADRLLERFSHELEEGLDDVRWTYCDRFDDRAILDAVATAQVLVTSRVTDEMVAGAPRLGLVHAAGAGTDGIARGGLAPEVVVANVFEHDTSIAEHVLMAMLAMSRDLRHVDASLRRGVWVNASVDAGARLSSTLAGRVVGLVGYGHIGQAVARVARALDMGVVAVRRRPELSADDPLLDHIGGVDDLKDIAARCDFLVVVVPLEDGTKSLIDAEVLAVMRPDAVLINVARGPVVDEDALYEALVDHRIGGAALDVWYAPPGMEGAVSMPSTRDFGSLDNVLLTPHVSGVTDDTFRRRSREIAANIRRFRAGEPLHNVV
jgi:phosphoglycerate dehydrogenase-like enzyme